MRTLGIIITLILWFLFGWKGFSDSQTCCNRVNNQTPIFQPSDTCPICFRYNEASPILCENWEAIKENLLESCDENDNIIIRLYEDDSEDQEIAKNRTAQLIALISGNFDKDRIIVRKLQRKWTHTEKEFCLVRSSIRKSTVESINESVVRVDDKIVFYFPANSINRIANTQVESYLNSIALDLQNNNKNVVLTGHTDNAADPEYNLNLGQQRADIIKDYLVSKGVDLVRIVTVSKGETLPIGDNSTDIGRAKNRRTELQIID